MRGLFAIWIILLFVAASGCTQTVSQMTSQTTPSLPSPVATMNATRVFTPEKIYIQPVVFKSPGSPFVSINTIGTHCTGDTFYINGQSDLPEGSRLHVDILQQLARHPRHGDKLVGFSSDTVLIGTDNRTRSWELLVDSSGFVPAMYDVTVTVVDFPDLMERASFSIIASSPSGK